MVERVAVVGAGSWGTTMASMLVDRAATVLWARRAEVAEEVTRRHTNVAYLPSTALPPALRATSSLEEAVAAADVMVVAVPSHGFRDVLVAAAPHVRPGVPVVSLAKGLEAGTHRRMSEVVGEVLPGHPAGVLTGPNLAGEIGAGQPAASVVAMTDAAVAATLQHLFATDRFRVYTNDDVVGCELAGALKNVVALAAGMVDGMGLGHNALAALVTRGLAELTRLGVALGGDPLTFGGLAGMGDLVATCFSPRSRNRRLGEELGRGRPLEEVAAGTRTLAEGVRTSQVVLELAAAHGVEVPVAEQVAAVCHAGRPAREAVALLMHREAKPEMLGLVGAGPGARARPPTPPTGPAPAAPAAPSAHQGPAAHRTRSGAAR